MKTLQPKSKGRPKSRSNFKRKKRKADKPITKEKELLLANESLCCEDELLKKLPALLQVEVKSVSCNGITY
ncbi:hypothetical protein [Flavobacterium urumqiense]|uniref:hypothetical protein n=1 Tax=Flavobacterium urumqiense TaxID=935224 RepID=UPI0011B04736|nr:hypothetical protein [Flavobacterium urumqiense]